MCAKKNSGTKVVAILLAVSLLIGIGVGGTLAWLTSTPDSINSTFTSGSITITLTEVNPR